MRTFRLLRGTALGDAFGAGLEHLPPGRTAGFDLGWGFRQNPRYPEISPGQFTDDTMLSVAAARALHVDLGAGRNPREDSFYGEDLLVPHKPSPTYGAL
jgi:ADP-ribosylglycohydrolase